MQEPKEIDIERKELNLLVSKGISIELERDIYIRKKGIKGLFGMTERKTEKLKFTIQEPTLSTLDRIAAEQIDLSIDEQLMTSENVLSEARKLTKEHSRRIARLVAIAVLGQDYVVSTKKGYKYRDKKLEELADLFFHNLKPSRLIQYVQLINSMSNLGDFTNSIRLMSASRTTMPILVEQKD